MSKTKVKVERAKSPKNILKKSTNTNTSSTLKRIKSSTALLNQIS